MTEVAPGAEETVADRAGLVERATELFRSFELSTSTLVAGAGVFVATFVGTLVAVTVVLVRLPVDYFDRKDAHALLEDKPAWVQVAARIGKNALGALLLLTGLVMAVPGVPGQGLLTMLIGLILLEFPGKRRLERRIVHAPRVLASINRLRARFQRPPIVLGAPRSERRAD